MPGNQRNIRADSFNFLSGQLGDIIIVQTKQVEDIDQTFSVQTSRCFELDLGLGAPGDTKASRVKH